MRAALPTSLLLCRRFRVPIVTVARSTLRTRRKALVRFHKADIFAVSAFWTFSISCAIYVLLVEVHHTCLESEKYNKISVVPTSKVGRTASFVPICASF